MDAEHLGLSGEARVGPDRKTQIIELLVFCFLIVPSMATSFFVAASDRPAFPVVASAAILRDGALVALIAFFLWRNGEPRSRIGWRWRHPVRELTLGVALFLPFTFAVHLLERVFVAAGLSVPKGPFAFLLPRGTAQTVLAVFLVTVVAISEETIFRGYLMLRLKAATRSTAVAVLISAAIFATGHGYEGTAGVATVGVIGAILAMVYLWRGSLIAPMAMHFLQDFVGVVLLPQFMQH